jgi:hypothetical protein
MRNYDRTPSLPEKAKGFTKRSSPEGHMVCCVALQTAPLNGYPNTPRGLVFCAPCIWTFLNSPPDTGNHYFSTVNGRPDPFIFFSGLTYPPF